MTTDPLALVPLKHSSLYRDPKAWEHPHHHGRRFAQEHRSAVIEPPFQLPHRSTVRITLPAVRRDTRG